MKRAIPWVVALMLVILITSCFLFEKKLSPIINLVPVTNSTLIGPEVSFGWNGGTFGEDQTLYSLLLGTSEAALTEVASEMTSKTVDLDLECNRHYFWKVVAKTLTLTVESEVMNFYLIDGMAKNPLPSDKSTEVSIDTSLSWETNQVEGSDYTYSVYFSEGNVPALVQEALTENSFDPGVLKNGTKYSWKIIVDTLTQSKEGSVWSFTTIPDPANNAPTKPGTPTPVNEAVDQAIDVNLGWTCSDPDGDALEYDVYFGSNANPPLITSGHASQTLDPGILSKGTTYYWKVVAKDGRGGVAESDKWSFTTIPDPTNNAPTKPGTPSPADGAVDQAIDVNLGWTCSDPDGDTLKYDVYFGSSETPPLVVNDQTSNAFDPGTLSRGTKYYWKVVAKDGRGGVAESDKWSFTTIPDPTNNAPTKPGTPTPADEAVDQAVDVQLSWQCSDPDGDILEYDVYFGSNTNPPLITSGHASQTLDPGILSKGTTYYWKVVAKDGRGGVAESDKWSFTTVTDPANNPPSKPNTPIPASGGINQSVDVNLKWKCTDPDGDPLKYDVYFGSNPSPSLVSYEQSSNTFDPGTLSKGTTYYWKVVAKDGRGGVTESDKWSFKTVPDPTNNAPAKPGTPAPEDGAVDQAVDVNLGWTCTDPDGDPLKYDVYFGSNSNPSLVSYEQPASSYDPGTLLKGTAYYWKVVAKDGRGGITESDKWSFMTSNLESPHSPSPSNDATDVLWDSVILSWDVDGDTSGLYYDIYFGKDSIPGIYRIGHTTRELTITNLDRGETYYWQVVVTDQPYTRGSNAGVSSNNLEADAIHRKDGAAAIGNIWSFTTRENRPPVIVWAYPADGATDISLDASLSWEFTDEDGDELVYDIYFDNNPDSRIVLTNLEDSNYSPHMEHYLENYYWKVVAKDGQGGRTETSIYRFTTLLIEWQKCLGGSAYEELHSVQQTFDGGYVVAGYAYSNDDDVSGNHGLADYWIVKLNSVGGIDWQKCLGGSAHEQAHSIQQTLDGGYIVAGGSSSNDGDVFGNHGGNDYWVVKLNSVGDIDWQKCLGGSNNDTAYSIQQTSDGGYVVAGYTLSNDYDVSGNHGDADFWIVKLDSVGVIDWQKCLGGSSEEYARSIQQTSDGGYIITGETRSINGDVSGNHGDVDFWLVKLEPDGTLDWQKCLGGTNSDYPRSVQQTSDGGYIVAGVSWSTDGDVSGSHGASDYWIVKLESNGDLQWQKCLGGSSNDTAYSIQKTSDGGYFVAGQTYSNNGDVSGNHGAFDYWVVKLESNGDLQWQKCLGGSSNDAARSIQKTSDGGYIVAGYTSSNDGDVSGNHGSADYWIVKTGIVKE